MNICGSGHSTIAFEGLSCPICELKDVVRDLEERVDALQIIVAHRT